MYSKKHFDLPLKVTNERLPVVAFYGNKVRATDSFRLIEIEADGEAHEPVCYSRERLKGIKLGKNETISEEQFELIPSDQKFPDVDKLIESDWNKKEYFEFSINGKYLAEFAGQMAKESRNGKIIIQIPKRWVDLEGQASEPLKVLSGNKKMTGYIMPMTK